MSNAPFYAPGNYIAEVTAQALGKAGTGTPQFVLRFRVLGKPDPKDETNYIPVQENERTMFRSITEKTIQYVTEDLEQLGYPANGFGPLDPNHPNHHSFVGQQIDVYCKHEKDQQGDLRERWQLSRGPGALKVEPLDNKGVRELDALFGKSLQASLPKTKPAPRAATASASGITDEDVPF